MDDHTSEPDEATPFDHSATDDTISDAELTALALAADPHAPIPDDAVPFVVADGIDLLPAWYMPAGSLRRSRPRAVVLAGVAIALFVINVGGVCVTYGIPDPVWK